MPGVTGMIADISQVQIKRRILAICLQLLIQDLF